MGFCLYYSLYNMGLTTIYATTQLYSNLVNYMNSTTYLCLVLAVLCSLVVSRVRLASLHTASLLSTYRLRSTLWETQAQSTAEACRQKWYYDRRINAVNLKPGNLVLVKGDAWKGKRKIKDRWEEETWEVVHQIIADVPSYEVTNQHRWS